jgi:hypothetical protein
VRLKTRRFVPQKTTIITNEKTVLPLPKKSFGPSVLPERNLDHLCFVDPKKNKNLPHLTPTIMQCSLIKK